MVVWSVTIPLLVVVASIALRGLAGTRWRTRSTRGVGRSSLWFTAVILMILVRFWNYWSTLI